MLKIDSSNNEEMYQLIYSIEQIIREVRLKHKECLVCAYLSLLKEDILNYQLVEEMQAEKNIWSIERKPSVNK